MFKNIHIKYMLTGMVFLYLLPTVTHAQAGLNIINIHVGVNTYYSGFENVNFRSPYGIGVMASATFNPLPKIKPTINVAAIAYPNIIKGKFSNAVQNQSNESYGMVTILGGIKYKVYKSFLVGLTAGPAYNSVDKVSKPTICPSAEFSILRKKIGVQVFYLKVFDASALKGSVGLGVFYKL